MNAKSFIVGAAVAAVIIVPIQSLAAARGAASTEANSSKKTADANMTETDESNFLTEKTCFSSMCAA